MQVLMKLIPPRLNYLRFIAGFALSVGGLTALVSIVVFQDYLHGFSISAGIMTGSVLAVLLMWAYDEIKKYERWSVVLTENAINVPDAWFRRKTLPLSQIDRQRTREYNAANTQRNRTRYTFWAMDGASIVIGKSFYGRSQINALLEEIGLPQT